MKDLTDYHADFGSELSNGASNTIMTDAARIPDAHLSHTAAGTAFSALPLHKEAATLLLFAMAGADTLTTEPYCRVGRLLHAQGWNVVSLDLPCHGADRRTGEPAGLQGWAERMRAGEDIVAGFCGQVDDVIERLVTTGVSDPARIAAAGTSRGGFLAFHAAAANPCIGAVAAFAPVTDLLALTEFADQKGSPFVPRFALVNAVEHLAGRAAWIVIGDADARVGTDNAVAFTRALMAASQARSLPCDITLRLLPTPGHMSFPEWHDEAATWFLRGGV